MGNRNHPIPGRSTTRGGPLYWLGRRRRQFWAVMIMLSLIAAYPVSFGPWCALVVRGYLPFDAGYAGGFYTPCMWATTGYAPKWLRGPYIDYVRWWLPLGCSELRRHPRRFADVRICRVVLESH